MKNIIYLGFIIITVFNSCKSAKETTIVHSNPNYQIVATDNNQEKIALKLVKTKPIPPRKEDANLDYSVGTLYGEELGRRIIKDDKTYISLNKGKTFEVEPYQYTLISKNGETIIQRGQPGCYTYCPKTDLLFYNAAGTLLKKYSNLPIGSYNISEDGCFARAYNIDTLHKSIDNSLMVFDPYGEVILEQSIGKNRVAHNIEIANKAEYIAISYLPIGKNGEIRNLLVLDKNGKIVLEYKNDIKIDNMYFLENNSYLAIFAGAFIHLFDINNSKLLWKIIAVPNTWVEKPMIILEDKGVLLTMHKNNKNRYDILVIDIQTGQLISKYEFNNNDSLNPSKGFDYNKKRGITFSTGNYTYYLNID